MTRLYFSRTPITALPAWVAECTSLEELYLERCEKLVEPPDVSTLASLVKLDLSNTKIVEPPNVSTLTNLETLDLEGCDQLRALPDVSANKNLKDSNLSKPWHLK